MKRDLNRIQDSTYDVVVIGGGMQGACTAYEAASRNLKTCLIEANDFCSGTSYNSLKIIHGGLRYLQTFDFARMRESMRERRALMRIAPHLVHPLESMIPTEPFPRLRCLAGMAAALSANALISCDRNIRLPSDKNIGVGRLLSKQKMLDLFGPGVMPEDMTGGAVWYDAIVHNAERLVLSFISTACSRHGLDAANYCRATGFAIENNNITHVKAVDSATGRNLSIRTRSVINCAGAWIEKFLDAAGITHPKMFTPCRVINLITKKKLFQVNNAVGSFKGGRTFFLVPWRDYWMVGTNERNWDGDPDNFEIPDSDIEEFLGQINGISPSLKLKMEDVCFVHKGILPSKSRTKPGGVRSPADKYRIYEHGEALNMLTVVPVKYTTGRDVAEKAINRLAMKSGFTASGSSLSADTLLEGSPAGRFSDYLQSESAILVNKSGLSMKAARHLIMTYGEEYEAVTAIAERDKSLFELIPGSQECIKAEIIHSVKSEMALKAEDILMRRTDIASGEKAKPETVEFTEKILKSLESNL